MTILGYASSTSVHQGDTIGFHLGRDDSSQEGEVSLKVECIGRDSISQTFSTSVERLRPPVTAPWEGYDWPVRLRFRIPRDWPSGLYKLTDNPEQPVLFFVVLPTMKGSSSKILLQISYLTPAAYNWQDEISFYKPENENSRMQRARRVSLDRPLPNARSGAALNYSNETKLIEWLKEKRIEVEYCSSIDLHESPELLRHYDCLVIAHHDEYWTKAMRDHCEQFIGNGGNVIVLSGNTCFRQVRLEGNNNRSVVFYKYAGLDTSAPSSNETAIAWAEPPVNRPQNQMLGVGFTDGAFFGRSTPYRFHFKDHWVFNGVSESMSPEFMTYEVDAADFVEEPEGYPRVTGKEGTPLNTTILGSADMSHWQKPGRATMTLYSRHGTVFNAATTDWVKELHREPFNRITLNVFNKLKRPIPWNWELIGHAKRASAMTAINGLLYLSTIDNDLWRRYPVGADVPWRNIGHAKQVIAMAADGDSLFCITSNNILWWRTAIPTEAGWARIGFGPSNGTNALAAAGGQLYAVDNEGGLFRRPATRRYDEFLEQAFRKDNAIRAMTSYNGIVFASTIDNRLVRTNRDIISESDTWHQIHHCNFSIGLAVVDWMLFVVTTDNWIWRIDLSGLKKP